MNKMLEELKNYGADINGAMERFLDDADLYNTCFELLLKDESFKKLGEALAEENYEKAFEHAHLLKGITGNMGLTPLYQLICIIVEALRNGEHAGLENYYEQIMAEINTLSAISLKAFNLAS